MNREIDRPKGIEMSEITFPFEIESESGGRWLYTADDDGWLWKDGEWVERAGSRCSEMVKAIETEHVFWPEGSCVYMGPARELNRKESR